ncbi:ATP-binding protein [Pseudomonas piscis]|uniref:histidine kinase n=1 Tax=Pseudomonas piscis TaxID=2614538 RepID=A0A7X1PLN1_9PSED|nr:ATP-binding protein [Pseudomonas piscis]MQA54459.1 response regulator [Pseudomonas piscis]
MRLKSYLHQINPLFSSPEAARRLLRVVALIFLIVLLGAVYNFLRSTLNNELSQRRGYMSSAITEAQAFFTTREALLESLSLATVYQPLPITADLTPSNDSSEEIHLRLGSHGEQQWGIWLTQRMRDHLKHKQLTLLYVQAGPQPEVQQLFSPHHETANLPRPLLARLSSLTPDEVPMGDELWLTDHSSGAARLYIFTRLDERFADSGWLGLEMDSSSVSEALQNQDAGDFMMFSSLGGLLLSSTPDLQLIEAVQRVKGESFFGFLGGRWWPDHVVIRKQLGTSDWQLVYSFDLYTLLKTLLPQLLAALLISLLGMALIGLLTHWIEIRLIAPAMHRLQALIESEAFSRDVVQIAPVALCVLRRSDGQVVLENALSQQWLGYGSEREQLCASWIGRAFDANRSDGSDYFETAAGRHLYLCSAPTRYKGEDVLFCAFSDITARKQIEATLEEAKRLADTANEAKTLFLATMSHEIRTPLYGVLGTLELLARTRLDEQQRDYLRAIEGSSGTLLQLICDVLDVSKIEAGQLALELSEFNTLELVHELIQSYAAAARAKGLQLYACVDPQLPEALLGDVTRIRQILSNLLNNAVKFTDSGRIVLRVRGGLHDGQQRYFAWQVSDTGRGISRDDQALIFEPFYQTEGNTNVIAGTGLGLPICQRLTLLMGGTLRMVSEPGLGSSFSLTLPLEAGSTTPRLVLACPTPARMIHVVSPIRELAESVTGWLRRWGARAQVGLSGRSSHDSDSVLIEVHPGIMEQRLEPGWTGPLVLASGDGHHATRTHDGIWQVNSNNLRAIHQAVSQALGTWLSEDEEHHESRELKRLSLHVLVVEDNLINQLILKDQLEELGCSVEQAANGEEALGIWENGDFDMVLTDVNMPRLNGYQLARELRRRGCSIPIIGATANAMRGEEQSCLDAGMNHCLVKPFALRALFNYLALYEKTAHEAPKHFDRRKSTTPGGRHSGAPPPGDDPRRTKPTLSRTLAPRPGAG